jgi:hypothetical protein
MSAENNQQKKNQLQPFFPKMVKRFQKTLFSFVNAIAESISSSVHIPEIAIGPIIGSLITATTTLIIGLVTISNIFSEQFLYRPLQLQDNTANYRLEVESYTQKVLTDYLNQMTQLTLNYPLWKLRQNPYLLRAITHKTLAEIDGERKRYVIMFLKDISFLTSPYQEFPPLFEGANLTEAKLDRLQLSHANLTGANLSKANLEETNLHRSNLNQAQLGNANLINADLRGASLEQTNLTNADLTNACYDVFTKFDPSFNPNKAKMRLVKPFSPCEISTSQQQNKRLVAK